MGPSLWGSTPLGGSGGQCCPEPFYIHHCSPSPSGAAVLPALCTIHLTYWEHISVSRLHIFFLPATSLPSTLSVCRFPWRLVFHVFVAKPLDTLERWYHSVLIACWWKCTFLSQGISYPEAARMTLDIGHCYHLLLHTVDHLSRCAVILHSRHATCFLWLCWISSHLHLHLPDHNQSNLI